MARPQAVFFGSSRNAVKVWLKVNTFALSVDDYDDDLNCLSSQLPFLTVSPLFSGLVLEGGFLWGAFGRKRRCLNIWRKIIQAVKEYIFFLVPYFFNMLEGAVNIQCQTTPLFEKRAKLDLRDLTYLYLYCVVWTLVRNCWAEEKKTSVTFLSASTNLHFFGCFLLLILKTALITILSSTFFGHFDDFDDFDHFHYFYHFIHR